MTPEENVRHAKDYTCTRCKAKAEVFVGLADPDGTQYPMCRKHADEWRIEVLIKIQELFTSPETSRKI